MGANEAIKWAKVERRERRKASRKVALYLGWDVVPPLAIGLLVQILSQAGLAILFGTTRDGDVLSVTLYLDGEKTKYYIRATDNPVDVLCEILDEHTTTGADVLLGALRDWVVSARTETPKSRENAPEASKGT